MAKTTKAGTTKASTRKARTAKEAAKGAAPTEPLSKTRDRILRESMAMFAEKGFAGTTVAEIESASGLSPGSGALYRHFRSKGEILVAGMGELRARIESVRAATERFSGGEVLPANDAELAEQLRIAHVLTLMSLDSTRDLSLTMMRSGSSVPPEVAAEFAGWGDESFANTASQLARRSELTGSEVFGNDPLAVAFVMMAPLFYAKLMEWTQGLPGDLTHQRIGAAWSAMLVASFGEKGNKSAVRPK